MTRSVWIRAGRRCASALRTSTTDPPTTSGTTNAATTVSRSRSSRSTSNRVPAGTSIARARASSSTCLAQIAGHEPISVRRHLDRIVQHPRRQGLHEPPAERPQRQRDDLARVTLGGGRNQIRPHHRDVDPRRLAEHDLSPDRPSRHHPHQRLPVRRQANTDARIAVRDTQPINQQVRGLGDPVLVRRHRQLDPLAGRVVVVGDERPRAVASERPRSSAYGDSNTETIRARWAQASR